MDDPPPDGGVGEGISARATLRTGRFWALIGIYFLAYGCLFSVMTHQHPYFTDQGFSAQHAALLVSVLLSASVLSGLGFGWASDRYDPMQLAATCYALGGIGIALLLWASPVVAVVGFVVLLRLLLWRHHPADRARDRAYVRHESARRDLRFLSDRYLFKRFRRPDGDGLYL